MSREDTGISWILGTEGSRLPGLQLPLCTGPRLWPQGGRLCAGHSSQHFFLWGVAWRSHESVASSAALRLLGYFFFFPVFTSGQSVCLQLVKTRSTRENNYNRPERPQAHSLEQAGILPNTVLTVPSGPFPFSPRPDVATVTRSPPPGPARVLSPGTWHQPGRCEQSGPDVSCHPSSQQVHSWLASL